MDIDSAPYWSISPIMDSICDSAIAPSQRLKTLPSSPKNIVVGILLILAHALCAWGSEEATKLLNPLLLCNNQNQ